MKLFLCNGSPKAKPSSSGFLLDYVEKAVDHKAQVWRVESRKVLGEEERAALMECDALVVAFPLYVDGIPGHLLRWMEAAESALRGRTIPATLYALAQCGFYEAQQNHIALRMMRQWCQRCGMSWGQGVSIGAGAMLHAAPVGKGPWSSLGTVMDATIENILRCEKAEDRMAEPNFPRFLYRITGNMGWKKEAEENGLKKQDLYRRATMLE